VGRVYGIFAFGRSPVSVENSGDITVATSAPNYGSPAPNAVGIGAVTFSARVSVVNSGDVNAASADALALAIIARTNADYSPVSVVNEGDLTASARTTPTAFLPLPTATIARSAW